MSKQQTIHTAADLAQRFKQLEAEYAAVCEERNFLLGRLASFGYQPPLPTPLPDDQQTTKLLELVHRHYPALAPEVDTPQDYREQFRNACRYLAYAQRKSTPDSARDGQHWQQQAIDWLKANGFPARIGLRAFTAAAIVCYVAHTPIADFPHVSFGLTGGTIGQPVARWPDCLRGELPNPVPRPNVVPRPPLQPMDMIAANPERW
jgi:hypothetical protein